MEADTDFDALVSIVEREAFASMMGQTNVLVFEDPRWGRLSLAFVEGGVLPYNLFLSLLIARLSGIQGHVALPDIQFGDAIAAIWHRIKLPATVGDPYRSGHEPHTIGLALIGKVIDRMRNADESVRRQKLRDYIGGVEVAFSEAQERPITTSALRALNAYVDRPRQKPARFMAATDY